MVDHVTKLEMQIICINQMSQNAWIVDDEDIELDPIFVGTTHVFCCKECRDNWVTRKDNHRENYKI